MPHFINLYLTIKLLFQRFSPAPCCSPLPLYTVSFIPVISTQIAKCTEYISQFFTSSPDLPSKPHAVSYLTDVSLRMFRIFLNLGKSIKLTIILLLQKRFFLFYAIAEYYSRHLVIMLEISTRRFPFPTYIKARLQGTFRIPPRSSPAEQSRARPCGL